MARLLFLAYGIEAASCRFRVLQYLPFLDRCGIQTVVADLHGSLRQRWWALWVARHCDAVCVHRAFLSAPEIRWLQRCGRGYVFDFDDAIMFRDSTQGRLVSRQRWRRFRRTAAGARLAVAGNAYLAAQARRAGAAVTVIPTPVDVDTYAGATRGTADGPVVGWIGTAANFVYLRSVVPALQALSARHPDVVLKVVADRDFEAGGVRVVNKRWSLAEEASDLGSFDVGIMPLVDDAWTRGKCAVKILQYFAAGLPVVCSAVGMNREIVQHGRSGYFAETPEEWAARLEELLVDAARRRAFGATGRGLVVRAYSLEAIAPAFVEALLGPAGGGDASRVPP